MKNLSFGQFLVIADAIERFRDFAKTAGCVVNYTADMQYKKSFWSERWTGELHVESIESVEDGTAIEINAEIDVDELDGILDGGECVSIDTEFSRRVDALIKRIEELDFEDYRTNK